MKVLVCLLTLIGLNASAEMDGKGISEGLLALQTLAEANPSMTPNQILLKAFEDSKGRIPEIHYLEPRSENLTEVYEGRVLSPKGPKRGLAIFLKSLETRSWIFPIGFFKKITSFGPLIKDQKVETTFVLEGTATKGVFSLEQQGLVLKDPEHEWAMELRSYNDKIIVFTGHYGPSSWVGYFWID